MAGRVRRSPRLPARLQGGGQGGSQLQSQIVDHDTSGGIETQVRGLDVAMEKALLVSLLQAARGVQDYDHGLVWLEPSAAFRAARPQRIRQIHSSARVVMPPVVADLTHGDEIRVPDLGGRECLPDEVGHEDRIGRAVGRQQLEHDWRFERQRLSKDNASARTLPQQSENNVPSQQTRNSAGKPSRDGEPIRLPAATLRAIRRTGFSG